MKKTTKKVAKKKTVVKKTKVNKTKVEKKLYTITMQCNDNVVTCETDSLRDGILSLNPGTVKTKMILTVDSDGKTATKMLNVFEAKRIFQNYTAMTILIKRIILK